MDRGTLNRMLKFVEESDETTTPMVLPCLEWIGTTDSKGRPRFWIAGRSALAKRAMFEIIAGTTIPESCQVVLLCQNPKCVRPEHLFLCNETDACAHGPYGEFCQGMVEQIRELSSDGYGLDEISYIHRVSVPMIEVVLSESEQ